MSSQVTILHFMSHETNFYILTLPVSIKHGLRTTDCRLGIKYGLGIKRGLRTEYKTRTRYKMRTTD